MKTLFKLLVVFLLTASCSTEDVSERQCICDRFITVYSPEDQSTVLVPRFEYTPVISQCIDVDAFMWNQLPGDNFYYPEYPTQAWLKVEFECK